MCVYCMIGDNAFRWDPPWPNQPPYPSDPHIPAPINPYGNLAPNFANKPWDIERLQAFKDLLQRVRELEDKLGCPCEPNKADYIKLDYIKLFDERIAQLEAEHRQYAETIKAWQRYNVANTELENARKDLERLKELPPAAPTQAGFTTCSPL